MAKIYEINGERIYELELAEIEVSDYFLPIDKIGNPKAKKISVASLISNNIEWTIFFSSLLDPVEIVHDEDIRLDSAVKGNIDTLEISINGTSYIPLTFTTNITPNTPFKLRVSSFNSGFSDGSILLKGTIL